MPTGIYKRSTGLGLWKMSHIEKRAHASYRSQEARCRNRKEYAGLSVSYSLPNFIAWYVKEFAKREKWHRPNVSRIDHSKGYFFGNIELQECSENSLERIARKGSPSWGRKKRVVADSTHGQMEFDSVTDAARYFGVSIHTVCNHCSGKTKVSRIGVRFEWAK